MTAMFLRSMLTGVVLAALTAAPASADVSLDTLKPCYVAAQETQREYVTINAHGFTPLATVDIYVDDILQPNSPRAAYNGDLSGSIQAPFVESGQREFTLRLAEEGGASNSIAVMSRVTRFSVEQVPKSAKTNDRVRFRGRGFTRPQPVYAHYVFGGRSLRTIELGMPKGNCGMFSVKRRQFPFKRRPRVGSWTIQFDQLPYFDPNASERVPMTIKVKRAPKSAPARRHASS